MAILNPTDILTPSEVVFLQAGTFTRPGGLLDKYKVLDTTVEVSKKQLALNAFAVAFFADECAGGTRLELRAKKVLLGLRSAQALYVDPCPSVVAWPEHSLESRLQALARQLQDRKGQNEVFNVVYALLGADDYDPFTSALDLIRTGLARRGLVTKTEEKKLKVITVHHYSLPAGTAGLAAGRVAEVQRLLAECQGARAEVAAILTAQIDHGIQRRKKPDDTSSFDAN